eukprot:UN08690
MDMVHECFLEIRYLEHENSELKHSLSESNYKNDKALYDCDGNVIEISYCPKLKIMKSNSYLRVRTPTSLSGNTPVVYPTGTVMNGDFNDYKYIMRHHDSISTDISDDNGGNINIVYDCNDKMEKIYDLYQAMNEYLFQIDECVQSIQSIQSFYKKTTKLYKVRASQVNL